LKHENKVDIMDYIKLPKLISLRGFGRNGDDDMIGRQKEKQYLLSLLNEEESQFVAVFGRRRIGKTYLVRETYNHEFVFQHTGVSNIEIEEPSRIKAQLKKFEESLKNFGYACKEPLSSWDEAFAGLKQVILNSSQNKKIIFH